MFIHEQLALQMAREQMAEAVHWVEQRRALRWTRTSVRVRLGRTLVRFGHWLADQPSAALSSHPNPIWLPMASRR